MRLWSSDYSCVSVSVSLTTAKTELIWGTGPKKTGLYQLDMKGLQNYASLPKLGIDLKHFHSSQSHWVSSTVQLMQAKVDVTDGMFDLAECIEGDRCADPRFSPAPSVLQIHASSSPGEHGDLWQMLLAFALTRLRFSCGSLIEVCTWEGRHIAGRAHRCRTPDQLFGDVKTMFALVSRAVIFPNTCRPVITTDIWLNTGLIWLRYTSHNPD